MYGMHATKSICDEIEKFCNLSLDSTDQHVHSRDSRVTRDNADVDKLVEWFIHRNPFANVNQIVSLRPGIVGDNKTNCQNASEIGLLSMEKIAGLKFDNIKLKRSDRVLPLSSINSSIKVPDSKVSIDPLLLFQGICLNKKFDDHLPEYLKYEPYPTALFDHTGTRKTVKSKLYDLFEPIITEICNEWPYICHR